MWECSSCGESVEDAFDVCWNCGTSRDGTRDPNFGAEGNEAEGTTNDGHTPEEKVSAETDDSPESVLEKILESQNQQQEVLRDIQSKVGCLYVYMIVGILLGVFVFLIGLAN